jgi:hypothetical protein
MKHAAITQTSRMEKSKTKGAPQIQKMTPATRLGTLMIERIAASWPGDIEQFFCNFQINASPVSVTLPSYKGVVVTICLYRRFRPPQR